MIFPLQSSFFMPSEGHKLEHRTYALNGRNQGSQQEMCLFVDHFADPYELKNLDSALCLKKRYSVISFHLHIELYMTLVTPK